MISPLLAFAGSDPQFSRITIDWSGEEGPPSRAVVRHRVGIDPVTGRSALKNKEIAGFGALGQIARDQIGRGRAGLAGWRGSQFFQLGRELAELRIVLAWAA